MSLRFKTLRILLNDMREKEWSTDTFYMTFNEVTCIVLLSLISNDDVITNPYALKKRGYIVAKIQIFDPKNMNNNLVAYMDFYKIYFEDAKSFYKFFNIRKGVNFCDVFQAFSDAFSLAIPTEKIIEKNDKIQEKIILRKISPTEPNHIYCYDIKSLGYKSNGEPKKRSSENSQKAQLLRPSLYNLYKNDKRKSFCFSNDPNKECTDEEILHKVALRNNR